MKKMHRKFRAVLLTAALMLTLAACGGASSGSTNVQTQEDQKQAVEPAAEDQTAEDKDQTAEDQASGQEEAEDAASAAEETGSGEEETAAAEANATAGEAGTEAAAENEEAAGSAAAEDGTSGKNVLVVYFSATGTTKGVAEKIAAITDADLYEITAAQAYSSDDLNWNDSGSRSTLEQNDPSARPEIGSDPVSLDGYTTVYIGFPIWWGEEPRIMDTFVETYDFDGITMIPFCTSASSGIGRSGQNLADKAGSGNWLDGERFDGSVSEADLQAWIDGLQ